MASASFGSLKYEPIPRILPLMHGSVSPCRKGRLLSHLKHEPLVNAVDHFASLLAGGVETEVLQDDETVKGRRSHFGPPANCRQRDWRARSWAPQPSVAMRDRSAAIALGASPVRSLMTCQRMAGSELRSHLMCAGRGA